MLLPKYTDKLAEQLRNDQLEFLSKLIKSGHYTDDGCDDMNAALLFSRELFNAWRESWEPVEDGDRSHEAYHGNHDEWDEFWGMVKECGCGSGGLCESIVEIAETCKLWEK